MNDANPAQLVPYVTGGAFALAFVFGAVANKTNFCTMGAVSDWVNMGDTSRMRMWLLAIAVALLGSSALHAAGLVDLSKSIYTGANFLWLSHLVGGFLFRMFGLFPNLDRISISLRDVVAAFVGSLIILFALWLWDKYGK